MPKPLTISIAMCTYNGERFLQEQLDSFLAQTRLPDELVVCDDGSQDGTVAILEAFAAQAPFPVRLFKNPQNLGFSKNFEKAISLCQGDIIALSDQDDVWLPEKLERFEQVFLTYPEVGYVFCDASVVNENLRPLGFSVWNFYNFSWVSPQIFLPGKFSKMFLKIRAIAGALMAIRTNLCRLIFPIPPLWVHDDWMSFAGGMIMGVVAIPDKFNKYRQHSNQSFGLKMESLINRINKSYSISSKHFINIAAKYRHALRTLTNNKFNIDKFYFLFFEEMILHLTIRANLPKKKISRIHIIFNEFLSGRYHKYSNGLISAVKDFTIT